MILAGNGSDDILTIATRTFVPPGDTLAYPEPTYSLYPVLAELEEAKVADGAVGEGLVAADRRAAGDQGAARSTSPTPTPPRGTFVSPTKVEELAEDVRRRWC